jgi:histidinol-phosphate aminotransferase
MYLSSEALASPLVPYTAGLTPEVVAAKYNLPLDRVSKLGSAENHFGASPLALEAVTRTLGKLSAYPEWSARVLREKIGAKYGYDPDRVVCGCGETEIISWVIRAFAAAGDRILMHEPCFPLYHKIAEAEGRVPVFQPMGEDFEFHFDDFIGKIASDVRVVFITAPHSPTGKMPTEADVRRFIEAARNAVVVLDEAYVHFSGTEGHIHLAHAYDNVIVMRTFSKVFGLGGLRVGFAIGHPRCLGADAHQADLEPRPAADCRRHRGTR